MLRVETSNQFKTQKSRKFPTKGFLFFLIALAGLGTIGIAQVMFGTITYSTTVNEPLSSTPTTFSATMFAGEAVLQTISVTNQASVAENATINCTATYNPNGVTFTVYMPALTIPAKSTLTVPVQLTSNHDSPVGNLTIICNLNRVA